MSDLQSYKLSFTTGGLFLGESVGMASHYLELSEWTAAIKAAVLDSTFSSAKAKSMQRAGREIANRLSSLDREELEFLVDAADKDEQAALMWLAVCRTYRLVREFAIEVVSEQFASYQRNLVPDRYRNFVHDKAEWDSWLAARADSTIERSGQVLFKIMREAGVLDGDDQISRMPVSPNLRRLLEKSNTDFHVFPGEAERRGRRT